MVERYPNLKEEVGGLVSTLKSPLYLTKNLSSSQLPHVLWCWLVGYLSQKKVKSKKRNAILQYVLSNTIKMVTLNIIFGVVVGSLH